jgi:hypothetical protein
MTHRLNNPTELDYRRWRSGTEQTSIDTKRAQYERVRNYDILEQLYNAAILSIDGMTYKGEPCTEANKESWIDLVPLYHKTLVLGEVYSGVTAKNE